MKFNRNDAPNTCPGQPNKPSENELGDCLSGHGSNVGGGYWVGGGESWTAMSLSLLNWSSDSLK